MRLPLDLAAGALGRGRARDGDPPGGPRRSRPDLLRDRGHRARRDDAGHARSPSTTPTPTARGFERVLTEWDSELFGVAVHLRTITRDGWVCTAYRPGYVHDGTEGELYDLAADPLQQHNRWGDPAVAALQSDLVADLRDHTPAPRPEARARSTGVTARTTLPAEWYRECGALRARAVEHIREGVALVHERGRGRGTRHLRRARVRRAGRCWSSAGPTVCSAGFHNVCRHRAGPLVDDGAGTCTNLVCQYHGWAYAPDGRLRSARDFGEALDPDEYALHAIHVAAWRGQVFVNLDADGCAADEELADFFAETDDFPLEAHDARPRRATTSRATGRRTPTTTSRGTTSRCCTPSCIGSSTRTVTASTSATILPALRAARDGIAGRWPMALPVAEPRDEHLRRLDERRGDRPDRPGVVHGAVQPLLRRPRRGRRRGA